MTKKADGNPHFIQKAIQHPGALHRALGVPEGQKIPHAKLVQATHSNNPHIAHMARFALTLEGMH